MKPYYCAYVGHCAVRSNACTSPHVDMHNISGSEALARLRCLGQRNVSHKSLEMECNKLET